jgi:hypothetical protein
MLEWFILIFVLTFIYIIMKKPNATTETPVSKPKAEKPKTAVATKAAKKSSPDQKTPKIPRAVVPKPVAATPEDNLSERVGLTAGSIWHYLAENGTTSVAKLVRELPEEEKTIQRSIGWLAQEGKVTLDTIDRIETIALKE